VVCLYRPPWILPWSQKVDGRYPESVGHGTPHLRHQPDIAAQILGYINHHVTRQRPGINLHGALADGRRARQSRTKKDGLVCVCMGAFLSGLEGKPPLERVKKRPRKGRPWNKGYSAAH